MNQLTPQEESPSPLTEAEAIATMRTFIERKNIREKLEREKAEGRRVDVADICICPVCKQGHYRPRETK